MQAQKKTLALIILDGWGYREETTNNAIAQANTPVLDRLFVEKPSTLISGSGMDVGLPDGQMGNSEVGHVNLGAGRVVYQDFTRITKDIADGEFQQNDVIVSAIKKAVDNNKAVHIMGLLSPGGVHSHQDHMFATIKLAAKMGAKSIYLHGFLDGRDTPPRSALDPINQADAVFAEVGVGQTATLVGRYFAMDRDNRWDRVQQAYDLIIDGKAEFTVESAESGLEQAYARDENDEFVKATKVDGYNGVQDGDAMLFMNFRADRAREMSHAMVDKVFDGFERNRQPATEFVMLTEFESNLDVPCAYPPEPLVNVMGDWLAKNDKTQLRISETEKFAHVTFFYSGGKEDEYPGEKRILIPSPDVATYDLQPEMNSEKLTDELVAAIKSGEYDAIICNYPNGDMVGHTGKLDAAIKACEAVDACIGRIVEALEETGAECLITADHGNAEQMVDPSTGVAHTAHTSEPVPFIYVGRNATARTGGTLSDVAPTMLHLLGMEQPKEMTGKTIMQLTN
ncbi:2,3-bisphosphoglycerate-independent phosphoglycerate mutase [Glaciecola sp. KUL10]|jgi:2,3-bisphosphoglycerate-independent phosphoglycerate mutase|uniref:2,3-bisphosphoglycerate-independent phosphoglycerate mutase n=1 Tax=Glaciecola sp. (strain KUL10) TaxID=2161813 RepID=UPI000D787CBC|nr:2,3-bisphosphoglycerate-independent phosphoglycerate mutase [Glaciecola sp. KUL10]GBL03792.1 phosphoglyceromutase [Glaciecola sp. KUL10]